MPQWAAKIILTAGSSANAAVIMSPALSMLCSSNAVAVLYPMPWLTDHKVAIGVDMLAGSNQTQPITLTSRMQAGPARCLLPGGGDRQFGRGRNSKLWYTPRPYSHRGLHRF